MLEKKRYGTTFTRTYVYIRLKIQNANSKIEGKFDRWKGENGITDGNRSRNFNSSETGASRQFHFDRITVVRNLRTEIKFRFTENEATRSLSPYLSSWYIYIYIPNMNNHARFPFSRLVPPLRNNCSFRHAFPFPSIPFSAPFTHFVVRERDWNVKFRGDTRTTPASKGRFNIRATSRDSPLWNLVLFGTWPKLFPRFSRY